MENEGPVRGMANREDNKGSHDMHNMKGMSALHDMKNMPGMPNMANMGESTSRLPLGVEFNILKLTQNGGLRRKTPPLGRLSELPPFRRRGAKLRVIQLSLNGMAFAINDRTFNMHEIAFEVQRGTREIWTIRNPEVGMPHPIHVHGFLFQVLAREGSPPQVAASGRFGQGKTVSDLGWKDTVLVWPGETVRIGIDFTHDFPGEQIYLLHCHNLEHEDAGMMVNFKVR
jgi:suppressor of ftsI/bilirubin oxidase